MTPVALHETAPPAPPRPAVVTVAFWFHVALVVLLLIVVGAAIADAVHYDGLIDEAARATDADPQEVSWERDGNLTGTLLAALPLSVLALWLGGTAFGMRRGSNIARILTWVGLGAPVVLLLLACLLGGFFGFFGLLAFGLLAGEIEEQDEDFAAGEDPAVWPDGSDFYDKLADLDTGGWSTAFGAIIVTSLALAFLLAVAVVVLLATGPAGRYFRPLRAAGPSPRPGGPFPMFPPPAGAQFPPSTGYPTPYAAGQFGQPQPYATGAFGYPPPQATGPFGYPAPPPAAGPFGYPAPPTAAGAFGYPPPPTAAGAFGYPAQPPAVWGPPPAMAEPAPWNAPPPVEFPGAATSSPSQTTAEPTGAVPDQPPAASPDQPSPTSDQPFLTSDQSAAPDQPSSPPDQPPSTPPGG